MDYLPRSCRQLYVLNFIKKKFLTCQPKVIFLIGSHEHLSDEVQDKSLKFPVRSHRIELFLSLSLGKNNCLKNLKKTHLGRLCGPKSAYFDFNEKMDTKQSWSCHPREKALRVWLLVEPLKCLNCKKPLDWVKLTLLSKQLLAKLAGKQAA